MTYLAQLFNLSSEETLGVFLKMIFPLKKDFTWLHEQRLHVNRPIANYRSYVRDNS